MLLRLSLYPVEQEPVLDLPPGIQQHSNNNNNNDDDDETVINNNK